MTEPGSTHTRKEPAALDRARMHYAERAWNDAYAAFLEAETHGALSIEDLGRLALSAALSGRTEEMVAYTERQHDAALAQGHVLSAAQAAFQIAFRLFGAGEPARASAWLSRCQRLVERHGKPCAPQGYLRMVDAQRKLGAGAFEDALEAAGEAAELGERFAEPDLEAFATYLQGAARLRMGRVDEGLPLLDEAMLAASSGKLSAAFTGVVYCSAIAAYQEVYALDRSREWTAALSAWCAAQPQLVTFTGTCQIHRAEMFELEGAWNDAVAEVRGCAQRFEHATDSRVVGDALYCEAEIYRLRGALDAAEETYKRASQRGREPQPGLALLRSAQGQHDAALGALRRVLGTLSDPWRRARYLPAYVDVALAAGALDEARDASAELETSATRFGSDVVQALADRARGGLALSTGDAAAALAPLRRAHGLWQGLCAPYLAARVRALIARACDELGDPDGAALERAAAREVFERLGAALDLAALDAPAPSPSTASSTANTHGLSPRELEVLRMLASGKTNKRIASELFLSEKTVDRHVSNLFGKLAVSSRAAATAFAYEHGLI